jgi:hypothetical protein
MPRSSALLLVLALASCAPPLEKRRIVTTAKAPLLSEVEDDERPFATLRAGELVEVVRSVHPLDWKAEIDGVPATRSGEVLELRRSGQEGAAYGFAVDFGGDVQVPTAEWLCREMQADAAACPPRLRRITVGDRLVAWEACQIGPCRVAVARGRKVAAITVVGLGELYPATVEGQAVLVATTRWVKASQWTGATTEILRVGDTLERALSINSEEVDSRAAPSIQRTGILGIEQGVLTFRGTRREVQPSSGVELARAPIVETYHLKQAP